MSTQHSERTSHSDHVPAADEFEQQRAGWRRALAADDALRKQAVELQVAAEEHHYTYTWEWGGVPIIRVPDDIVMLQQLFWEYRPERVIETGVARGGSMLLDASLQRLCGLEPAVLGIDLQIFEHTHEALSNHPLIGGVQLLESDSTDDVAVKAAREFIGDRSRAVLILDSNHTHEHVLAELEALADLLPVGGMVLVADTLIEEFPDGHFANRPWGRGNNPFTAVQSFLESHPNFVRSERWGRGSLLSEFRDGVIVKLAPR